MQQYTRSSLSVVAALIVSGEKILITQRPPGKHFGLMWEFPGGKVEADETDEEALERELREELDVEARIGPLCFTTQHSQGAKTINLKIYRTQIGKKDPKRLEVHDYKFVSLDEMGDIEFLPADLRFVSALKSQVVPLVAEAPAEQDDDIDEQLPKTKPAQILRRIQLPGMDNSG